MGGSLLRVAVCLEGLVGADSRGFSSGAMAPSGGTYSTVQIRKYLCAFLFDGGVLDTRIGGFFEIRCPSV